MLEHATLLFHDWTHATLSDGERAWIRPIRDVSGHSVGFVRFVGDTQGSWFSWFHRARLDVYETDDAAHLLSLTRSWGMLRLWEVDDAEDRHVGSVYTKTIVSSEGDRLGYLDRETDEQGRILDSNGVVLLRFGKSPDGLEVVFQAKATANPFVRMLMLGCVLALDAVPRGESGERQKGRKGN
jgi:hypothetical protein